MRDDSTTSSDSPTSGDSTVKGESTAVSGSTAPEPGPGGPGSARILVVIEDDPDVQFLIKSIFSMDPRFAVTNVAESAEEALDSPPTSEPGIIVLDHGLAGPLPGLAAAPMLKELAPLAKIIMFTAHAALQARADKEPAIDAFLLKTDSERLLPLALELLGLDPTPA